VSIETKVPDTSGHAVDVNERLPSFRCSAKGKESALCVLQVVAGGEIRLPLIVIHVVPKFWSQNQGSISVLNIDSASTEPIMVTVHETGQLIIRGEHARLVSNALKNKFEAGSAKESSEGDKKELDQVDARGPLFTPMPDVYSNSITEMPQEKPGTQMQALLSLAVSVSKSLGDLLICAPEIQPNGSREDLLSYLSRNPILMKQDAMANLLKQLFIVETLEALKRRKPDFRNCVEKLSAVRGSIVLSDIPRRRARRTQKIECEFEELETASEWFSLIRCAARIIVTDTSVNEETRKGAVQIERALVDTPLLSPRNALSVGRNLRMTRKHKHWIRSTDFAKSVLQNTQSLGGEESSDAREKGFAAHVYIPTAELFERMLVEATRIPDGDRQENPWILQDYKTSIDSLSSDSVPAQFKLRTRQAKPKSPDMISTSMKLGTHFVVDAKYKERPDSMNSMGMTDQYQQFAYALIANLPTLFLYAQTEEIVKKVDIDFTTVDRVKVGLAAVPFPKALDIGGSHSSGTWKNPMNKHLQELLNQFSEETS